MLDGVTEVSSEDPTFMYDRLPSDLQTDPAMSPEAFPPIHVTIPAWLHSKPFFDMVYTILLDPNFQGDIDSFSELVMWPRDVSKDPLSWAKTWRESEFVVPMPFRIGDDYLKNETLDLMASCARNRLIACQGFVKKELIMKERLEMAHATTEKVFAAKLESLKQAGKSQDQLDVARKTLEEWADGQKHKHQVEFDNAKTFHQAEIHDTVVDVINVLKFMIENHGQVIQKDQVDRDLLAELELELDSQMQDVVAATPMPEDGPKPLAPEVAQATPLPEVAQATPLPEGGPKPLEPEVAQATPLPDGGPKPLVPAVAQATPLPEGERRDLPSEVPVTDPKVDASLVSWFKCIRMYRIWSMYLLTHLRCNYGRVYQQKSQPLYISSAFIRFPHRKLHRVPHLWWKLRLMLRIRGQLVFL